MKDKLPPMQRETGSLARIMALFVVIQVTVVLFAGAVFALYMAASTI